MSISFSDLNSGAKFVRADLHIHSFGDEGSYDVVDATMTPENIVDTAIHNKLKVIAITDHNEIGNVKRAVAHAQEKDILVIPGIEISTTQGHLLVYFEQYENLRSFFGRLTISESRELCSQGIVECLNLADQFHGIGIVAHIELTSGFVQTIGRYGPQMEQVLCHPNLWAIEVSNKQNAHHFSDRDTDQDRKRMLQLRKTKLGLSENWEFPVVMSSDSHTLNKLGINAEGEKRLTRIKMDSLSYHSFKVALKNCSSRIRLEDFIPEKTPCFIGLQIDGGLLDKQRLHLNKNLTCIIGGRGAGKSTLLECIRETSGNSSNANVIDSEVWPEKIHLLYEDETGRKTLLTREKNGALVNVSDPINGLTKIDLETYGQGETAETIQYSNHNPAALIKFLDSFIDITTYKLDDEDARLQLITNQSEIGKLRVEVSNIPETKRQKLNLEAKLEKLKQDNVGDLVKYHMALIRERSIRKNLIDDLNNLVKCYKDILEDRKVFAEFEQIDATEIIVGKENFDNVKAVIDEFSEVVSTKSSELKTSLGEKIDRIKAQLADWKSKESAIQETIDEKRAELESKGIPFDLGKINQITIDVDHFQNRLKTLNNKQAELTQLLKIRSSLIQNRTNALAHIHQVRLGFARLIKENLKNSVDGFYVDLKFAEGKYSPEFEESIKSIMGWRTSQVPKAKHLANFISPLEFATGAKKRNLSILTECFDENNNRVFNDSDIQTIIERANTSYCYEDFESQTLDDFPILTVTKMVEQPDGSTKAVQKNIAQLSLGQQQSIILSILLHSKRQIPLLIDQPEDNLDSEFIYKTIVENLKKIKERRQVIIVTHNANIAVLGDAELIVPLKSTSIKSRIVDLGSIDRKETRAVCCEILEGGVNAFKKRRDIYGIS